MTDISTWGHVAAAGAACVAGIVNAVAGGGTLISFPVLTAVGVPAVRANATNTVALCPGYVAGTFTQRDDLVGVGDLKPQAAVAAFGGLAGSLLLVVTSESAFRVMVPVLILLATVLLAVQDRVRTWLKGIERHSPHSPWMLGGLFVASVYGGYFGAGLGIMLVAVLGLFSDVSFTRINAVKQLLSFTINVSAAILLSLSGKVEWTIVAAMAPAAIIGGALGGRLAQVVDPKKFRSAVILFGFAVSAVYFAKL